jgi:hypothetical protein
MANPPGRFDFDPQFKADMMAHQENEAMNKLAAYAARGRLHKNLSEQQLKDAWKQALKNVANNPRVYEARSAENDLGSELKLRGLEPPYEEAKNDFKRFTSAVIAMAEDLRKDPVRLAQRGAEWMADIVASNSAGMNRRTDAK